MECEVLQESVLDPLLSYIFLIDLCFECKDSNIGNYGNDKILSVFGENILAVILELQSLALRLFKWFENNDMKAVQN